MARTACTGVFIVLLALFTGCQGVDVGRGQMVPQSPTERYGPAAVVNVADKSEADLVEQMAVSRQAYRQGLQLLVTYYTKTGNNMKLEWAEKELNALDTMPKYNYIVEAVTAGPNLKPTASIPQADDLYYQAVEFQKKAGPIAPFKNENSLRLALEKCNQLIKQFPTSDKIDDAAYMAGTIYEYFKDYSIALLYYQRAFQWDPDTIYPARFRAARILDQYLHRKDEALKLYQEALKTEGRFDKYREWKEFAERRIREMQKTDEAGGGQ
jgi:tetratricopeptide (TPR) repeat protein